VMALRAAAAQGAPLAGGTAWVSLEPCAHHGRTPPCADALIAAGLSRVVVALGDPDPQVAGRGVQRLRAAGITVDVAGAGPARQAAQALNIGFLSRVLRGRPWLRLKVAASLDGRTALPDGRSQWITGPAARQDGHAWRRRAGAVLTGIGTVLADDPRLDVRLVPTQLQPLRVVVDSAFATPPAARLLQEPGRVLVVGAQDQPARMAGLRAAGAEVLLLPGADGRVDLPQLLQRLAANGVGELHVEAGAVLNAALIGADLVDELLVYTAPRLLGPGRGMAALPELPALDAALGFDFQDCQRIGTDLRLLVRRQGADAFLHSPPPAALA
jgi:diaminohydroxyphosphoribosylaminopyrimidine deaminase/5-amino-6-(5-phosphoribosylamino)uracil reductase